MQKSSEIRHLGTFPAFRACPIVLLGGARLNGHSLVQMTFQGAAENRVLSQVTSWDSIPLRLPGCTNVVLPEHENHSLALPGEEGVSESDIERGSAQPVRRFEKPVFERGSVPFFLREILVWQTDSPQMRQQSVRLSPCTAGRIPIIFEKG
jgi:hypothetical protein